MAKAVVDLICSVCGNEFTHTHMCCDRKAADSYEKWATENVRVCQDCYRQEKQKKHDEQVKKITEDAGLVDLKGTEKQVKWAVEIRASFFEELKKIVKPTAVGKVTDIINHFDDSVFWIEHRHESISIPKKFYMKMKEEVMNQEVSQ